MGPRPEATEARARFFSGDLSGADAVLAPLAGDREIDLARAALAVAEIGLRGRSPDDVVEILTPHLDSPRAIDLIGFARFESARLRGTRDHSESLAACMQAGRRDFDRTCWKTENAVHIGIIQQALGYHDMAEVYLRDAHRAAGGCPPAKADAALHLGIDALARGSTREGVELLEEAVRTHRRHHHLIRLPGALVALADAVADDDPLRARDAVDEAITTARIVALPGPLAIALTAAGRLEVEPQMLVEARDLALAVGDLPLIDEIDTLLR